LGYGFDLKSSGMISSGSSYAEVVL